MRLMGITFNNEKHTYDDWGLSLSDPLIIPQPDPNITLVSVPGGNGFLNLTTAMTGEVTYSQRKPTFTFTTIAKRREWQSLYSEIANYLHGKEMSIVLDEDPWHYYTGVFQLNEFKSSEITGTITIEATLDPFKYELEETQISVPFEPLNVTSDGIDLSMLGKEAKDTWNTDYRFGSSAIPTLDLSAYANIAIGWEGQKTYYQHGGTSHVIQIVDGNGNFYEIEEDTAALHNTIKVSDISAAGVDVSNIYRILVQSVKTAIVKANAEACMVVHVEGSKFPSVPIIEIFYEDVTLAVNGKTFEVSKGIYNSDDIIITESGADFLFFSPLFEDPEMPIGSNVATITYQKGWL
ncbi:MAG: hypothetical protein LUE11_05425 [Clostridia bacterium]|nr:hypothetical protein [Clostridia bacterium]